MAWPNVLTSLSLSLPHVEKDDNKNIYLIGLLEGLLKLEYYLVKYSQQILTITLRVGMD